MKDNKRSLEAVALGSAVKHGGKAIYRFLPYFKIILSLIFVRIGFKKKITFKYKYMLVASCWADRLGMRQTHQYTYLFPGGLRVHRALGIPEYDNSQAVTIMGFEKKEQC